MPSQLIINITDQQTRVALLEHGVVTEFHVEPARKIDVVGNIYKARVMRVLPGMQAAFLDIGLERAAFLYVADIVGHYADSRMAMARRQESGDNGDNFASALGADSEEQEPIPTTPIEKLIRDGQELLVQVSKEPLGSKGARVTNHVSLPGRYLVLMPTMAHVGISRRIEREEERNRLKELVEAMRPDPNMGFIVRTVAEDMDESTLRTDVDFLMGLWDQIQKSAREAGAPSRLHSDLSITQRAIRDLLNADVERVIIDNEEEYNNILALYGEYMRGLNTTVELYAEEEPIFERFGLELEIDRTLQSKVWLKSGGYIIIQQTEALTSIDVNTGRYVGKRNFEETILNTNLEAVKEICYQLRLRNIGGLIIIDFIDMAKEANRERVYNSLVDDLKNDKARTNVLPFSELGLVEMTRKRTRENIVRVLTESCPYCEGRGYVRSRATICSLIFTALRKEAKLISSPNVVLYVNPDIADMLYEEERQGLEDLKMRMNKKIIIKDRPSFHIEQYEIVGA